MRKFSLLLLLTSVLVFLCTFAFAATDEGKATAASDEIKTEEPTASGTEGGDFLVGIKYTPNLAYHYGDNRDATIKMIDGGTTSMASQVTANFIGFGLTVHKTLKALPFLGIGFDVLYVQKNVTYDSVIIDSFGKHTGDINLKLGLLEIPILIKFVHSAGLTVGAGIGFNIPVYAKIENDITLHKNTRDIYDEVKTQVVIPFRINYMLNVKPLVVGIEAGVDIGLTDYTNDGTKFFTTSEKEAFGYSDFSVMFGLSFLYDMPVSLPI